jgi:hypothetical protein
MWYVGGNVSEPLRERLGASLIIDDESSACTIVIVLQRSGRDAPENREYWVYVEEDSSCKQW